MNMFVNFKNVIMNACIYTDTGSAESIIALQCGCISLENCSCVTMLTPYAK